MLPRLPLLKFVLALLLLVLRTATIGGLDKSLPMTPPLALALLLALDVVSAARLGTEMLRLLLPFV
jgi:hypothetical protein